MALPDFSSSWTPRIEGARPGYRELVQALEADIRSGVLSPGSKLPTHRELSVVLEISRGTVARAFDEAKRLGLVRSGIGQGTFVADAYEVRARRNPENDSIELGLGYPLYELDPDPAPVLDALARSPERFELLHYPPPGGPTTQKAAGAQWCADLGVKAETDAIFVTLGALHATHLWAEAALAVGDTLLSADLTYRMVMSAVETRGVTVRGVAMDREGILPEALDRVAAETGARGLYIMPTIQNPTTGILSPERRRALLEVAERHDLQILEDDIHGYFHPEPRPVPLGQMAPERVTYVASLSKTVAGGLRVAFAIPPADLRPAYLSAILTSVYSAPPLTTELAARWIEDGTAQRTIAAKVAEAGRRLDRVEEVLGPLVPEIRRGAYFAWIELPRPWTATALTMEARRRNVSIMPAEPFFVGEGTAPEAIRISLGSVSREQIEAGLEVLRDLLAHPVPTLGFLI